MAATYQGSEVSATIFWGGLLDSAFMNVAGIVVISFIDNDVQSPSHGIP